MGRCIYACNSWDFLLRARCMTDRQKIKRKAGVATVGDNVDQESQARVGTGTKGAGIGSEDVGTGRRSPRLQANKSRTEEERRGAR